MSPELWLNNLAAYSVQIAALVAAAAVLAWVLRLRNPAALYRGWQLLLVAVLAAPLFQPWREAALSGPGAAPEEVSSAVQAVGAVTSLAAVILAVLACGTLVRLSRLCLGLVQLRRLRRTGRRLRHMPEPLSDLREQLGRDADLYLSPVLDSAASFGVRRPAVLLPHDFAEMNPPAQKAVLCHELLHLQRRDWAFAFAEEVVRSLFWFHPAVWWVVERIQLTREQVVDRDVIALMGERDPYQDALLQAAALRARSSVADAAAPTFLRTRHLRRRVALIVEEDRMSINRLRISLAAVVCALALTATWAVWSFPLQQEPNDDQEGLSAEVFRIGNGVSSPRLVYQLEPQYSEEAREAKLQGSVVLAIEVGADGFVRDVQLRRGLGLGLDENAMDAIRHWQFSPALKDGQPVPVAATVEVNYRLM
jgi:TonB family protein